MDKKELTPRQQQRKDALIRLSRECFQTYGLHGTTLAVISKAAELSVGQIYRLFINKEEIVEAVVNQIVSERVASMLEQNHDLQRKAELLALETAASDKQRLDNALLMEINAESLRNSRFLAILTEADQQMKREAARMIVGKLPQVSAETLADSSELIATLVEGVAFRRIYPQDSAQRQRLAAWYKHLFDEIYSSTVR